MRRINRLLNAIGMLIVILVLGGTSSSTLAADSTTVLLVLDASGSMWGQIDGTSKIEIAKKTLTEIVADLPDNARVGLILYGHRRKGDCKDVEQVVPLGPLDRAALKRHIEVINPKGKTPITLSLQEAIKSLREVEDEATVLLVSDGKETCDADPCAVTRQLKESGIGFVMHVIGFDVAADERAQLECIAKAGGGKYYNVANADDLVFAAKTATGTVAEAPASGEGRVWLDQPAVVGPGGELKVHFEAAPTFHANAWVGIVPAQIEHGSEQVNDAHDLTYAYLRNRTAGTLTLTAPARAGAYDVRMHDSDTRGREVASASFTVEAAQGRVWLDRTSFLAGEEMMIHYSASASLGNRAWIGILPSTVAHGSASENDRYDVSYRYISGETKGTVTMNAPTAPGSWDVRLHDSDASDGSELASTGFKVTKASGELRLERDQVAPGEEIVVYFTVPDGLPGNAWAGIIPSAIPHGDESTNDDNDLQYRYLGGKTSGTLEFTAPQEPGSYDVRLNDTDSDGNEIASVTFTVE